MKKDRFAKSKDIIKEKRLQNLQKGMFKPGESGNPKGKPKGLRNYSTLYKLALQSLARKNNMDISTLELEIIEKGILNARRGEYKFYKDLLDRLHGMANQSIDVTTGGKELPAPIIRINRE